MKIRGECYFYDGRFVQPSRIDEVLVEYQNSIYEVLRVIDSIPVFLEDHYQRFENSFRKTGAGYFPSFPELKEILKGLIAKCGYAIGNIRVELFFTAEKNHLVCCFIPHAYPAEEVYKSGVHLVTFPIERHNPEIKQASVNKGVLDAVMQIQQDKKAYEVLLVNSRGNVTEGSKSNIFFIRNRIIYTPSSEQVLKGITRQKTIFLIQEFGLQYIEDNIQLDHINSFDSCFLTGTSPRILPVQSIDSCRFNPTHDLSLFLIKAYDDLITDYCKNFNK